MKPFLCWLKVATRSSRGREPQNCTQNPKNNIPEGTKGGHNRAPLFLISLSFFSPLSFFLSLSLRKNHFLYSSFPREHFWGEERAMPLWPFLFLCLFCGEMSVRARERGSHRLTFLYPFRVHLLAALRAAVRSFIDVRLRSCREKKEMSRKCYAGKGKEISFWFQIVFVHALHSWGVSHKWNVST